MANSNILMSKEQKALLSRLFTWLIWVAFLAGNFFLFITISFLPGVIAILGLICMFLCELALLGRYARFIGQWRIIFLFWLGYSFSRAVATWANASNSEVGVTLAMILALYFLFAAWLATAILAIRRDVSVAYLIIGFVIGPVLLQAQVLAAGGLLAWLRGSEATAEFEPFALSESVIMAISCMVSWAILTFVPHLVWIGIKELRRTPL